MTTVSLRLRVGAKLLLHIIEERLSFHSPVNYMRDGKAKRQLLGRLQHVPKF